MSDHWNSVITLGCGVLLGVVVTVVVLFVSSIMKGNGNDDPKDY